MHLDPHARPARKRNPNSYFDYYVLATDLRNPLPWFAHLDRLARELMIGLLEDVATPFAC
jgi:hypothetical protein